MEIYNRISLNSFLLSLFPIILFFNSIDMFEIINYIFLLIFMVLTFFIGLITSIGLKNKKEGFLVGFLGAADTLFILFVIRFIFVLFNFEISLISQSIYSGCLLVGIFLSWGYIEESKKKGLTPFRRAAYIPCLPFALFPLMIWLSMSNQDFFLISQIFLFLIMAISCFGYSLICGFGGLFGTFIERTKLYIPKEETDSIPSTISAIYEKCPACDIEMESLVAGVFQCPVCKKIIKQKVKEN